MTRDDDRGSTDKNFATPVLKHFTFLEEEHSFSRSLSAIAHESVFSYRRGNVEIRVIFEIPDIPFLSINEIRPGRIPRQHPLRLPKKGDTRQLVLEYEKRRDSESTDKWLRNFRAGLLDDVFDKMIYHYARRIRSLMPNLLAGDFSEIGWD
ncbi:MAG: hypothetical protein GY847_18235 [Proteobacteria bacterium]|nr:hypothetical protein [Pseudomonadota bacterium]